MFICVSQPLRGNLWATAALPSWTEISLQCQKPNLEGCRKTSKTNSILVSDRSDQGNFYCAAVKWTIPSLLTISWPASLVIVRNYIMQISQHFPCMITRWAPSLSLKWCFASLPHSRRWAVTSHNRAAAKQRNKHPLACLMVFVPCVFCIQVVMCPWEDQAITKFPETTDFITLRFRLGALGLVWRRLQVGFGGGVVRNSSKADL